MSGMVVKGDENTCQFFRRFVSVKKVPWRAAKGPYRRERGWWVWREVVMRVGVRVKGQQAAVVMEGSECEGASSVGNGELERCC